MKKIQKGKFYSHYDKSRSLKHPALVIKVNHKKNKYDYYSFTHDPYRTIKLKQNINPNDKSDCYVQKKVFTTKRKDLKYNSNYSDYKVSKDDKPILKYIRNNKTK